MDSLLANLHALHRIEGDDRVAIESTKTHQAIERRTLSDQTLVREVHILHDLDLEILSSSRHDYEVYRSALYGEYFAASSDHAAFASQWRQGRQSFLQTMLSRNSIYKTPLFSVFEQHAQDNMQNELDEIKTAFPSER
jgi:predicted metal-dependent HD superfamily phosphohydrolase